MIEKFEMRHFFLVGMIVFGIVLICSSFNLYVDWNRMRLSLKVSELAMKVFYVMLVLVFYKNYKTSQIPMPEITDQELDEITKS